MYTKMYTNCPENDTFGAFLCPNRSAYSCTNKAPTISRGTLFPNATLGLSQQCSCKGKKKLQNFSYPCKNLLNPIHYRRSFQV